MKFFILCSFLLSLNLFAQGDLTIVAVGDAEQEKQAFVVADPEYIGSLKGEQKALAIEITELIRNDFSFYRHVFQVFDYDKSFGDPYQSANYAKWKGKNYSYVVGTQVTANGSNITYSIKAFNVLKGEELYSQSVLISARDVRSEGHKLANGIYHAILGKESIFTTKIYFVSDLPTVDRDKQMIKELYMMDFDGRNVERLTFHQGYVISPAVSPDQSRVVYSYVPNTKIKAKRNVNLFEMDLTTRRSKLISEKPGLNSGATFSSDGKRILLTLSMGENSDIYEMDLSNGALRRITTHYSDDVDPSLNQAGDLMSFLSGRSGRAMIYTMDPTATEKNVKRISFVGRFNATPRFSPDGKEIVFSSWVDNRFDIYKIGSNGQDLVRMTKNFGSNEEPGFSKDGEFIIFTSQRVLSAKKAIQNVYIMNKEGEILGQLTRDFGNCSSPRWTN
ncbi:MAG: PD40 domain-containing protein [Bacteriovoracaceae bacterium]|nr:PD40 domain-containing protein [Bacteriovoracaceae bacterium]